MSYPRVRLADGEQVIRRVHHHGVVLLPPMLIFLVCLGAWLYLFIAQDFFRQKWAFIGCLIFLALLAAWLLWRIVDWIHAVVVLTDKRVVYQTGLARRFSHEIPLSRVSDIYSSRGLIERIIGMGDMVIEMTNGVSVPLVKMPDPEGFKTDIMFQLKKEDSPQEGEDVVKRLAVELERSQPTREMTPIPPERPPIYSEIVEQIDRLSNLAERGSITWEEFEEAKRSLLERLEREE
ncbi:MAG: PH domain-containing protein [Actinomycetota bacterium]|nr:PH domain-containing protein [Actinomycetota bacterium]